MSKQWSKIISLLAYLIMLTVNTLANLLPFNNQTTGEISDKFKIFFVPAGYVFSIWGLIYLTLAIFVAYQFVAKKNLPEQLIKSINLWFWLSCLANATWIYYWHYNLIGVSVIVMLVLLVSLIMIYLLIAKYKLLSKAVYWCIAVPFSIYLGWITVATIANVSVWLYSINWNGFNISSVFWTVIMICIATVLTVLLVLKHKDPIYGLVIIWAFIGIVIKFNYIEILVRVILTTLVLISLVVGWAIYQRLRFTSEKSI